MGTKMIKFNVVHIALLSLSFYGTPTFAMEALDETDLAQATGQDGMTIGLNLGASGSISFDHIAIEDRDGITTSATHNLPAGLAYITQASGTGVKLYNGTTPIARPIQIVVDADGNNGSPLLNAGIQFDPNLSRINLAGFSLGLVTIDPSNLDINQITRRDILKTGADGIDITFKSGNPLGVNLQLGHQPQGALFMLTGGSIDEIKTAQPLEILSYSGCSASSACASSSSIKFGFRLNANTTLSPNGLRLGGIYMNTSNNGLEIGKAGALDAFDVNLSKVSFGSAGTTNATVFNGLQNGAIGNIGLEGIKITDLKTTVRGL